jgi:hypothetical protein
MCTHTASRSDSDLIRAVVSARARFSFRVRASVSVAITRCSPWTTRASAGGPRVHACFRPGKTGVRASAPGARADRPRRASFSRRPRRSQRAESGRVDRWFAAVATEHTRRLSIRRSGPASFAPPGRTGSWTQSPLLPTGHCHPWARGVSQATARHAGRISKARRAIPGIRRWATVSSANRERVLLRSPISEVRLESCPDGGCPETGVLHQVFRRRRAIAPARGESSSARTWAPAAPARAARRAPRARVRARR